MQESSDFVKGECRHCSGHLEFPASAAGQTVTCPHCGQPTDLIIRPAPNKKKSSSRTVFSIAAGLVLLVAIAGSYWIMRKRNGSANSAPQSPLAGRSPALTNSANTRVRPPGQDGQISTNDFLILPFSLEKTPGSTLVYVTGAVSNLSNQQRFGVKIEFGLFDSNDVPLGPATDYQSVLDPHAQWHFKAMVIPSKTAKARFKSIIEQK